MSPSPADHKKGLSLGLLGGLALSFDIPLIRLADGDVWSVQLLRSVCILGITLVIWLGAAWFFNRRLVLIPGREGLLVTLLYGISSLLFFFAVYQTPTANLVFILAFNPMFSALLGWATLGEKPKPPTFLAMIVMTIGVFIIVREGLSGGHVAGDISAIFATLTISLAIVFSRASGKDMAFTGPVSAVVPMIVSLYFVIQQGGLHVEAPSWIVFNGLCVNWTAFYCLSRAPKFVSGAEVAMFYLLETVFAPIWVWMIFNDVPSNQALVGGGILLAALIAHISWELWQDRRPRTADGV